MPSRHAALALLVLVVVAGCSTNPGPAGDGATPGPASGASPPESTPTVSPASTDSAPDVVAYDELPDETRRIVRAAVENGSVRRDADAFDGLEAGEDRYVRYDGRTYALEWHTYLRAEYALEVVERGSTAPVESNGSVVSHANLTETERRLFHRARNSSDVLRLRSGTLPDTFSEHRYVEHRGRYYQLLVVVADVPQWELRVEAVHGAVDG